MLKRTLGLGAFATLAMLAPAATAQTKLNWAHVYEVTEPFHTESVWAAEEIGKRTDGRYEVAVFPASQLGKEADINQGLKLGTVDIIISGSSFAAREYPPIGITYYPYIFRDPDHLIAYTKSDVFKRLAAGYEEASGNHITAVTYYGTRQTTANKEIKVCADLEGVKMRVPDVPAYLAMPQSCGANTAPIAFAEVYLALQNGTVDAQENPLTTIEAKKFYEVQTNISLTAPHRRPPQHRRLRHPLGLALRRGQGDLHRGDAGGGRARHQHHQGARGGAGADLQGQGHHRHRARQADLHRRRAQEQAGGEHGLRPGGLRRDPGDSRPPAPDPRGRPRGAPSLSGKEGTPCAAKRNTTPRSPRKRSPTSSRRRRRRSTSPSTRSRTG